MITSQMFLRWFVVVFGIVVIVAAILFPVDPLGGFREREFFLEFEFHSEPAATPTIYLDLGSSFSESYRLDETVSKYANRPRFKLPPSNLHRIRIDPAPGTRSFTIESPLIFDSHGLIHRQLPLTNAKASNALVAESIESDQRKLDAEVKNGEIDPFVALPLARPLLLAQEWNWTHSLRGAAAAAPLAAALALCVSLVLAFQLSSWAALRSFAEQSPQRSLFLASLAAVSLSCAPTLFFDKSFVSPNFDEQIFQTHQNNPTLPNLVAPSSTSMHGSDLGATAWIHKPYSDIQAEAILEHGEVPLWNRYNLQGVPLLGQGQSMIFDPLHWPTILSRGSSAAWDAKYLLARFLFCFAMGNVVFSLWRRLPVAILVSLCSAFLGFFYFRFNHAAYFGFCYMPLILWAWALFSRGESSRMWIQATWLLLAGNSMTLASGTIKEAYMYVLCMNLAGFALLVLQTPCSKELGLKRIKWSLGATLISVLATAPVWLTFIDAFFKSSHIYNHPQANQLSIRWLAGLFDDIYLRQTQPSEKLVSVSGNWISLVGLCGLIANYKRFAKDRAAMAILLSALFPFALVFGIVPGAFLESIPLVQGFHHVHDIFAAPLVALLLIASGFGFVCLIEDRSRNGATRVPTLVYVTTCLILVGLFAGQSRIDLEHATGFFGYSGFAGFYALAILAGGTFVLIGWIRLFNVNNSKTLSLTLLAIGLALCLGRYAQNPLPILKDYTMRPPERVDTNPPTYAIERMKEIAGDEPYRAEGVIASLFTGYSGSVGIEGLGGGDSIFPRYHQELTRGLGFEYRWGWRIFHHPRTVVAQHPALDFLNTRFLVSKPNLPEDEFEKLVNDDQLIFRSDTAWPRAFFTNRIRQYSSVAELRPLVEASQGELFAALTPEATSKLNLESFANREASARAINYRSTSNTTQFEVEAPTAGLAVLHESYWPGDFRATVNGESAEIIRVNHSFKAVALPEAGVYEIRFIYDPPSWWYSLYISAFGFFLLAVTSALGGRVGTTRRTSR